MKDCKIKEIIENNIFCISEAEGDYEEVANAMKEYAELYCEEFRQHLLKSAYHYENLHVVDFSTVETLLLHPHE